MNKIDITTTTMNNQIKEEEEEEEEEEIIFFRVSLCPQTVENFIIHFATAEYCECLVYKNMGYSIYL